jgi:hypothetical protein
MKTERTHIACDLEQMKPSFREYSGACQFPQIPAGKANVLSIPVRLRRYLMGLGFFLTGGFFSPPLGLISAKKSLALNG